MNELTLQPRREAEIKLPIQLAPCAWTKNELVTHLPARVPLDLKVESRRAFDGYEQMLRLAPHHFAHCGATLLREQTVHALRYHVTFHSVPPK